MTLVNQVLDLETAESVSLAQLADAVNRLADGMPLDLCHGSHAHNILDVSVQGQSMVLCLGGELGLNLGS